MDKDTIDDETYSLIFTSLKHPIRRRILRMLAEKPLTFSQIQEELSVDSGLLSYHLDSLGELIMHPGDETYKLSSFGEAAVKLMGGVEEQTPKPKRRRIAAFRHLANVYALALAILLILASLYFITYSTAAGTTDSWVTQTLDTASSFYNLPGGSTVEMNVTLIYVGTNQTHGILGIDGVGTDSLTFQKASLISNLTAYETGSVWLDMAVDRNQLFPTVSVNDTTISTPSEDLNVSVSITKPDSTVATDTFGKTSISLNTDHFTFPAISASESGTYKFKVTNHDPKDLNVTLRPNVTWQLYLKPYIYYGIAGIVAGAIYLGIVVALVKANFRSFMEDLKPRRVAGGAKKSVLATKRQKLAFIVGVIILVVFAISLFTYVLANNTVGNALNDLQVGFDSYGGSNIDPSYALYSTHFLLTNNAKIPLNLTLNFTAYATLNEESPKYPMGSLSFENLTVRSGRTVPLQVTLNTTDPNAIGILRGRVSPLTQYSVTIKAQGTYTFWQVTKERTLTFLWVNPRL